MFHFLINKMDRNKDLDRFLLNNGKKHRKPEKCNYWALDPKSIINNLNSSTQHSHGTPNKLGFLVFPSDRGNLKLNVMKEKNSGCPFFC